MCNPPPLLWIRSRAPSSTLYRATNPSFPWFSRVVSALYSPFYILARKRHDECRCHKFPKPASIVYQYHFVSFPIFSHSSCSEFWQWTSASGPGEPPLASYSTIIVKLVWNKDKKRPAFYFYVVNRFFAFAYYVWDTIPLTSSGTTTSRNCAIFLMCDGIVTLIATLLIQVVLQLRIYALYQRSRKILVFLAVLCVLEVGSMVVLIILTMTHLQHLPIASTNTGCAYEGILKLSTLFWIPGLIYEPILFFLVIYKAWNDNPKIPLIKRMARDSLIYFLAIFAELLISTLIWARAPQYINIVNPWSAALPSILGSRIMLGMREYVDKQGSDSYILETCTYPPEHPLQMSVVEAALPEAANVLVANPDSLRIS